MGVTKCLFCSGLILPDNPPKVELVFHRKCWAEVERLEKKLGRNVLIKEYKKFGKEAREDYVLTQLACLGELPWGYRASLVEYVTGSSSDGIPDSGLDNMERQMDMAKRVKSLPEEMKNAIIVYYFQKGKLTHQEDRLRGKAIKRLGEV